MINLNFIIVALNKFALAIVIAISLFVNSLFAQEKNIDKESVFYVITDKNASDQEMKDDAKVAKDKFGINLKYSKIKRNSKGEITGIKIEYSDKDGHKGMTHLEGEEPIYPIQFYKKGDKLGFDQKQTQMVWNSAKAKDDSDAIFEKMGKVFIFDDEKITDAEDKSTDAKIQKKSIIIKQKNGEQPEIIVDGKKVDPEASGEEFEKNGNSIGKIEFNNDKDGQFTFKFNNDEILKIDKDQVEKFSQEMGDDFEINIEKIKEQFMKMIPEMEKLKDNFGYDKSDEEDIKRAKEELKKAKEEMEKAREEMKKAKDELEKTRTTTPSR